MNRWHIAWLLTAFSITLPWISWASRSLLSAEVTVVFSGLAILGAAFLISWSSELAQYDIPRSLAMALLALIAVLPEYAVDIYLVWKAARHPEYVDLAAANMTGANRLLVGVGWSAVVWLSWLALRRQGNLPLHRQIAIAPVLALEVTMLSAATVYSLILPLKASIAVWDAMVFISLFIVYVWMAARTPHVEPEPAGPVALLAQLPLWWRRLACIGLFVYSGIIILTATEPFTEGLIRLGKQFGVGEFLLIQWIAPLASESPEMIILSYFAVRGQVATAMSAIISSKINQWTLLIGSLPVVYSLSAGHIATLPLGFRSREEILLTAAQSLFACALIANRLFSRWEAMLLLVLFVAQLVVHGVMIRYGFALLYLFLALSWGFAYRHELRYNLLLFWHIARRQPLQEEPLP